MAITKRKARAHQETYGPKSQGQKAEIFIVYMWNHNTAFIFYETEMVKLLILIQKTQNCSASFSCQVAKVILNTVKMWIISKLQVTQFRRLMRKLNTVHLCTVSGGV